MAEWLTARESPAGLAWWAGWCCSAGILSAAVTFAVIHWAARLGVVDRPNARSSHSRPTPRGGGVAIVAVGLAAAAVLLALGGVPPAGGGWVLLGAIVVAGVSAVDDVSSMSPRLRLAIHLSAAGLAVFATDPARAIDLGSLGVYDFGPAGWALAILWIVGMTNAFNFMDGIDGIAGITALAALAVLSAGFSATGNPVLSLVAAAIAAAAAGFLMWTWHPARIFMGDVGSAFLGYTIAAMPLLARPPGRGWLLPLTACVMWPFIFDTAYTLMRRLAKRENILEAHRSHLYQRLVIAGWSHQAVATLYGSLSAVAGLAALFARLIPDGHDIAEGIAAGTVVGGAILLVSLVHMAESRASCRA